MRAPQQRRPAARHGSARRVANDTLAGGGPTDERLVERLRSALNREDPVPLYHQIASVVRWEIGMGRAALGQPLPGMRQLASALGVNYHTVRQAYRSLAEEGVVEPRRGSGTVVLRAPERGFWTPSPGDSEVVAGERRVYVVECNLTQSAALAEQVGRTYRVAAIPWLLKGWGEPPSGVVLGSTFHELEMRREWPDRVDEIHALELELERGTGEAIRSAARALGADRMLVVERDHATGESIAADLRRFCDPGLDVTVLSASDATGGVCAGADTLVIYAPRVWDSLPREARLDPRTLALAFPYPQERLAVLASKLGWTRRRDD